jgi:hypothetical protein
MPINEANRRFYEMAAKRYQRELWEMADRPDADPAQVQEAQRRLNEVGSELDAYTKASRKTDENGRLTADPDPWIAPKVDPPKAAEPSEYSFFFEPSVQEVRNFIRNDPDTARRIGVTEDYISGVKSPEAREEVLDPASGARVGFNVRPAVTWLDEMTEQEPPYSAVANHLWQQRMEQARQRGEGVKRYRDVRFEPGQRIDYLSGGLEYNIDRRLAPLSLGAADAMTAGQATQSLNAAHDLLDYSLSRPQSTTEFQQDVADPMTGMPMGQNTVTPQAPTLQPDAIPSGDEVIARSPGLHLAGNLAGYALPMNPANAAQEMLHAGLGKAAQRFIPGLAEKVPGMIGGPLRSAASAAAVNTGESAIQDFSTAVNQGATPGEAVDYVGQNAPLQAGVGAVGGAVFDAVGQAASAAKKTLGSYEDRRALQNLKTGGGDTSIVTGVTAPPEVKGFVRESLEGKQNPDGTVEPPLGSASALASDRVVPHIRDSMRAQQADVAKGIEAENQAYFRHPAYRGIEHPVGPIVNEVLDMVEEGAVHGPVTGEPGNIDPERLNKVAKELRVLAEPEFVQMGRAQEYANARGYRVMDAQQAQRLWGRVEPPPAGTVAVIVPRKLNADLLTQFEQRIDRQFQEGDGYKDPIYTRINRAAKEVRDLFPYFEDEAGNLVAPPGAEGEFVDPSSGGPDAPSTFNGPDTPPTETDPGPSLPPSGGPPPPQLPPGGDAPRAAPEEAPFTMRSVVPEEATPLSLLAGNRLAMPDKKPRSHEGQELLRKLGARPRSEQYNEFIGQLSFLQDSPRLDGDVMQEVERIASEFDLGPGGYDAVQRELYPEDYSPRNAEPLMRPPQRPDEVPPVIYQHGREEWQDFKQRVLAEADRQERLGIRDLTDSEWMERERTGADPRVVKPGLRAANAESPPTQRIDRVIRGSVNEDGLADVSTVVKNMGGDAESAKELLLDLARREVIELRPEGGLNRYSPQEEALMIAGPHGTKLSKIRILDEDALRNESLQTDEALSPLEMMLDRGIDANVGPNESLPAPSPKEWTEATKEGEQWYEDIVTPGAPARADEAKRFQDLTEQQGALEEARAEIAEINRRLGPISESSQMKMLLEVLSYRLGRQVTKEDLVKAGLLAGGAATIATSDDDDTGQGGLAAAAVIGGMGGGDGPKKGPRQPRATLDDGTEVLGFSAKRRQQHERLSKVDKNKELTSAGHERALRNKVIGFNQGDDIDVDRALAEEAKKAGKLKELRTTAATSVYPGLRRRAGVGSGRGFVNNLIDWANFRLDKILEVLGGEPRNPFRPDPEGLIEGMGRRGFNLRGGALPARYTNDALRIYEQLYPEEREEEEQTQ